MTKPPVEIKPGVVFWPIGLPGQKDIHPWVVISLPVNGMVLMANFTDAENDMDDESIFKAGEHSCLKIDSIIYFSDKSETPAKKMAHVISEGRLVTQYPPLSQDILNRVLREARRTEDMSDRIKIKYGIIKASTKTQPPF